MTMTEWMTANLITLAELSLGNFTPAWFWLFLLGASLAIVVLGYRPHLRRLPGRRGPVLLAMRLLAVLIIFVALVKPQWTNWTTQQTRPALAVVVDDSQSMAATDAGSNASRYERVRSWWEDSDAADALREDFDLSLMTVSEAKSREALPVQPNAEQTDLTHAIRAATNRLRGRRAAGIVLVSDGRETTDGAAAIDLDQMPLPIYAVGFPAPRNDVGAVSDLAILRAEAPDRAMVDNEVTVMLTVTKSAGPTTTTDLTLSRGDEILATQPIDLPAGRVRRQVPMKFIPQQAGDFMLAARIAPPAGERGTMNNTRHIALRVDAEPINVVYLEGTLRLEYTFLSRHLTDDPDVNLVTFVRTARASQGDELSSLAAEELLSSDRLEDVDVVLLGDFESAMMSSQTYERLRQWVDAGGGLMVLGGYRNVGPAGLGGTPLNRALPVDLADELPRQSERPFQWRLTEAGRRHPAFVVTGQPMQDANLWHDLPALAGMAEMYAARPAAAVLAERPGDGQTPDVMVLVTQRYGQGLSVMLAADTTWRWSRIARLQGKPDMLYARFWSQMIRWLAKRDPQDRADPLVVSTDAPMYERGERVRIQVRRNVADLGPDDDADAGELELSVRGPTGDTTTLSATPDSAAPQLWRADFYPPRGGAFEVSAAWRAASDGSVAANDVTRFLVQGASLEIADTTADPQRLIRLAQQSGGRFALIDDDPQISRLLADLPRDRTATAQMRTTALWHHPLVLIAFVALLSIEWFLRRRSQLA